MNLDLFDAEVKNQIKGRFQRLTSDTRAHWGKMNVSQMMLHCTRQLRVALGHDTIKPSLVARLFGSWARKKVLDDKPFQHSFPTAPSFIIREQPDFEKTRTALLELIDQFSATTVSNDPHPLFGIMSPEEWSRATWKHLDHHLKQFGN